MVKCRGLNAYGVPVKRCYLVKWDGVKLETWHTEAELKETQ